MDAEARLGHEPKVNGPDKGGHMKSNDKGGPADKTLEPGGLVPQRKSQHPEGTANGTSTRSQAKNSVYSKRTAEDKPSSARPNAILLQGHVPVSVAFYETAENIGIDGPYCDSINGPDIAYGETTAENVGIDGPYCDGPSFDSMY